jgi:hypothetical protein
MQHSLFRFIVGIALLFALCACGGSTRTASSPTPTSTPTATATTAPTIQPTDTPTTVPTNAPTATSGANVNATHGTPHLGGPISDFYGKYGTQIAGSVDTSAT